ncbi:WYL domain-containing protein [Romboutsia weinsteinii]|uniref:WYL domain-containing protein n=1 Tax=Romboutsia weinsteinii TaxID=2020949 RepID=A0A371J6X2_9FIRM|nr:WYL domain-containing protein [Romboutsia weinsteinii]RDY28418.1 WYL domain-containing protein [Romboutsia weinsteinii]
MPKDNHIKFYTLIEILKKYSNEENILTKKEIDILMIKKGIQPINDSRTISKYINDLIKLGFDIEIIEKNNNFKGYYMVHHEFEPYELRILADCIYASKFITKKKSEGIITKLGKLNTIYNRYSIQKYAYIDDRAKTENKEIFYNIDKIDRAINENRKISFNYYSYNEDKKMVPRLNDDNSIKEYCINPVSMILQRDKYYLVGEDIKRAGGLGNFRLDRIKKLSILEDEIDDLKHIEDCKNKFNPVDYTKKSFKMYSGKEVSKIVLEARKKLLNVFIDEFGKDVDLKKINNDLYKIEFEAKVSRGLIMWILQQGDNIKVIYPKSLIKSIKEEIEQINNLYK